MTFEDMKKIVVASGCPGGEVAELSAVFGLHKEPLDLRSGR